MMTVATCVRVMLGLFALSVGCGTATAATLSGRVTTAGGSGVFPVDIDVRDPITLALIPITADTTDALGFYSMTLPTGSYFVSFTPDPASHLFTHVEPVVNVNINTTFNAVLSLGVRMSGRVVRTGNTGVEFVDLDFNSAATGDAALNVQDDTTDSLGFFSALIDPGIWNVTVIAPLAERLVPTQLATVNLASDVAVGDITLNDGHIAMGTVTDLGFFPLAGMDLDVRPAAGGPKLFTPQDDTAPDGSYGFVIPAGVYDITAGPSGSESYAPATARSITVAGDVAVPNLALPAGVQLRVNCQASGAPLGGVDLDVDSLPAFGRLEIAEDQSDSGGDIRPLVSVGDFRLTLSPLVASKRVPVRLDSVRVVGQTDLGTIQFPSGQWVSGTVAEAGTGTPIGGANLDFISLASGALAITPGDVTDATGFFRVVLPPGDYRLRVAPPSTAHDSLDVNPVNVTGDLVLSLALIPLTVSVTPGALTTQALALSDPWPNPSRGSVRLHFRSAAAGPVELSVWDLTGRRVRTLYRGTGGSRSISWNGLDERGRPAPVSVYYIRLTDGRSAVTRRVVRLQ